MKRILRSKQKRLRKETAPRGSACRVHGTEPVSEAPAAPSKEAQNTLKRSKRSFPGLKNMA